MRLAAVIHRQKTQYEGILLTSGINARFRGVWLLNERSLAGADLSPVLDVRVLARLDVGVKPRMASCEPCGIAWHAIPNLKPSSDARTRHRR
jgi:hypothetical protein